MTSKRLFYFFSFIVFTGLVFSGAAWSGGHAIDYETWTERGKKTLAPFKKKLMGALKQSLAEGPEVAVDACRFLAPKIAEDTASTGVRIGRTSHKLRNKNNAPNEWLQPLLDSYLRTPGKTESEVIELEDGDVGYVEPIYVKQICLACHGSSLSPSVSSLIAKNYPGDQAQGFEEGDFRGLFWIEFRDHEEERN